MISNIDSNYGVICRLFNFSKEKLSDVHKKKLIEMAKNKEPRPNQKTKLGAALCSYSSKKSNSYDKNFTNRIKKIMPNWFVSRSKIVNQIKIKLINMAKNGRIRPKWNTKEGKTLSHCTTNPQMYDKEFDKKIRKLAPDWFESNKDKSLIKKQKLIEMAKRKEKRPKYDSEIGRNLSNYTSGSHSSYDENFNKKIRELIPDWFVSQTDFALKKKKELLDMAENKSPKPTRKTMLGRVLRNYTCKASGTFDKNFNRMIRSKRPDWFRD